MCDKHYRMMMHLITTQQNNGEGSNLEKGSNKNDIRNTTKLNSLILYSNFSFILETRLANAYGILNIHTLTKYNQSIKLNDMNMGVENGDVNGVHCYMNSSTESE